MNSLYHAPTREGRSYGPLWAWAVLALLIPFVGLIAGIVYLFKSQIGPGLALVIEAIALIAVYAALLG